MCDPTGQSNAYSQYAPAKPEEKLSDLLHRITGTRITPPVLRMFLRENWREVACYAHRIHEG